MLILRIPAAQIFNGTKEAENGDLAVRGIAVWVAEMLSVPEHTKYTHQQIASQLFFKKYMYYQGLIGNNFQSSP